MAVAPYDFLETVLQAARIRLNDAIAAIAGEVITDTAGFTIQTINNAWRRLQEFLAESNAPRLVNDSFILTGLPINTSNDPGLNAQLNWSGYTPVGAAQNAAFVLPQDMIFPLRLWERPSGVQAVFTPMEYAIDGLHSQPKGARNYQWEWKSDSIFLPGSTAVMDIKIEYASFLADFVPNATTAFTLQPVPILRSLDAFAWYIASEAANARGDMDGTAFDTKAEAAATRLVKQAARTAALRSQWTIPDIPAQPGNAAYDTVSTMLNTVRTRINALAKGAGDVVTASQPFTQQCVNTAWRRMQEFLLSLKYSRLFGLEVDIIGIPVTSTTDPGITCNLTWSGYFSGSGAVNAAFVLPQTLIRPLKLWERVNGSNAGFTPMEYSENGLGNQPKQARNYSWEWVGDSLNFPGSTSKMDLRIRYAGFLPDFVTSGGAPWYLQNILIVRGLDALAWYTCFEIASSRPDLGLDADTINGLQTKAETACTQLIAKDTQAREQRGEWTVPDIPTAPGNTPYDRAATVLNVARARLNRAATAAGDVISANQPFTQQYFNNAWRKMQGYLANLGYIRLTDETILTAVPIVQSTDPASQVSLSWTGFFDGANQQSNPILPDDLIFPLKIWERQNGFNADFCDPGMENMLDGIPAIAKRTGNYSWEWRNDAIYMPGSMFPMDLRIRYAKYLPDFVTVGSTPWYALPVTIARCSDALSLYICAEVSRARPDLELVDDFAGEAEAAASLIFNRDVRAKQRVNARRRSHSGRLESGGYYGYGSQN